MKTKEIHTFISPFHFSALELPFYAQSPSHREFAVKNFLFIVLFALLYIKNKKIHAIPCKLKKNNLYLRLGKNNLNVHAYEDNVDFTNFSPLDIKNATFGSQGRYAGLYEKALH